MATEPLLIDLPDQLEGPRVLLRPYQAGDGAALFEAVDESRDHLYPWLPWVPGHDSVSSSEVVARRLRASWESRTDLTMAIFDRASGRFLGGTGFHRIDWDVPSMEIGYWIRESEEGKGYVTESVRVLTDYAFDVLGANRVFIRCAEDNVRSAAIPPRLGYVQEGILRNSVRIADGTVRSMLLFSLIRSDRLTSG